MVCVVWIDSARLLFECRRRKTKNDADGGTTRTAERHWWAGGGLTNRQPNFRPMSLGSTRRVCAARVASMCAKATTDVVSEKIVLGKLQT